MVTAIVTIIMFLVMVSLHEFGHFITGRLLNFKILEYSIGFGPAVWHSKKSEIQYSLRAIPFGGYCKFEGEDEASEDKRAFSNQPVWKRMIVVAAGGIVNIILGFVLFLIIVPACSPMVTNVIDEVVENSYIEEQGILPGDEVVEINGRGVSFYNDIALYTQDFTAGEECEMVIKRGGEKLSFTFKPSESVTDYVYTEEGIEVSESMNGVSAGTQLYKYGEGAERDEAKIGTAETVTRLIIGFRPRYEDVTALNVWGEAWNQTRFMVKIVYNSLWQLVTGRAGIDQMSGPVGIVSEVSSAVHSGESSWLQILNLTALLTINLGVFNLLPIPALDGGRLLFMIIELIRRKPIPPDKEGMVHAIGFLLLIALIVFVSFNDIMRLIR